MGALKHLRAIITLPVMVTLVIPSLIVYLTRTASVGWALPSPLNWLPVIVGLILIGIGLVLWGKATTLCATVGKGTLAPWDPTQWLVVRGVYRHVRNPMISGGFAILLGETILVGSIALFCWFLFFLLVNVIFIPLWEEPDLARRFGEDYIVYKKNVPRWIPRLKPWQVPFDK